MQRAIAGLIVLATFTVPIQSVAQTPPPAPMMPPSLPAAHVVNLMTNEGSGAFGVQWRVADIKMVEVPAPINKDRYKTTYQIEPRAMATDFDDSQMGADRRQRPGCAPQRRPQRFYVVSWAAHHACAGRRFRSEQAGDGRAQCPSRRLCGGLDQRANAAAERLSQPRHYSRPKHAQSRCAWHRS